MRILIFHGYLLRGTGSNVYNASLARALAGLGHEVHLLCQDRAADQLDWVSDEPGPGRVTVYIPDIGRVLPVYVADEYEGFDAITYDKLSDDQLEHYLDANVAAVRDVADQAEPDVALANHLVMGPAIVARAIGGDVPYAVKVHGSALEYVVRPHSERFLPYAREGLEQAGAVLVGSRHTGERLWEVMDDPDLPARTRLGPPGVDAQEFVPLPPAEARVRAHELADRIEHATGGWGGEAGAAEALRRLDPENERIVGYVGKLIVSKGVDLLVAAWPDWYAELPEGRLCVIGFGTFRDGLARLVRALAEGDLDAALDIASRGRELEGGERSELSYLKAFLEGLEGERRDSYFSSAARAFERLEFTGRLEHGDLPAVLPAFQAQVVPSTFPEAFGMVAVEAAACGALPLSAAHSGLAEVTRQLAPVVDEKVQPLLAFEP